MNLPFGARTKLPINLTDLLRQPTVEGESIEYKAGWNPDPIIRTVCAFSKDIVTPYIAANSPLAALLIEKGAV